jgi:hypothetical protein
MDVFDLRARLVADYQSYTRNFGSIPDYALTAGFGHSSSTEQCRNERV